MYEEFVRLSMMEGDEPIRCSRMHFKEWAEEVLKLEMENRRCRKRVADSIKALRDAIRVMDKMIAKGQG